MHSTSLFVVLASVASLANAATPPNFEPASNGELIIAFGNTLATQGVDLPKASTQSMPTIGTSTQLTGTYSIILVDPDIPSGGQFLHWMQTDLVSSNVQTTVAGRLIFALTNPSNTVAVAPFTGPAPPARAPLTHRYISLLVNTTGNTAALSALSTAGASRRPFDAQTTLKSAGLTVLAAGWFNVTNTTGIMAPGIAPSGTGAASGTGVPTPTGIPFVGDAKLLMAPGLVVAGLGAAFVLFL